MTNTLYPYIGGDLLENRHSYTYTPYLGEPFLEAWQAARATVAANLGAPVDNAPSNNIHSIPEGEQIYTAKMLEYLLGSLHHGTTNEDFWRWLRWTIQRFEVSKRVFTCYEINGRKVKGVGGYRSLQLYLRLAEVLAEASEEKSHLPSLNALIKCLDTLCSCYENFDERERGRLGRLISKEVNLVAREKKSYVKGKTSGLPESSAPQKIDKNLKILDNIVLLAADTLRSRGYAQALFAHGFRIGHTLIVEAKDDIPKWGQSETPPAPSLHPMSGCFVPDLRIPLMETCARLAKHTEVIKTGTINCAEVQSRLQKWNSSLAVYSGFGGELVKPEVIGAGVPLLHMHAGWLPEYRGSTTVYYSWLREGYCGVSAILLSSEIDEGDILARKKFPPPAPGCEPDYEYDAIIRSDVLLEVINETYKAKAIPEGMAQDCAEGETYFIIHPVLKHIAMADHKCNEVKF